MRTELALRDFLFICGCPRSGTTALWQQLVFDGQCALGVERYGNRFFSKNFFGPAHFEKSRFFRVERGDTFYDDLASFSSHYTKVEQTYDQAAYVGDKIPRLYEFFDKLIANFDHFKVIMIFRNIFDVAASYKARLLDPNDDWKHDVEAAISDWNASIRQALEFIDKADMHIVDFEELFEEGCGLQSIYRFLGLEITAKAAENYKNVLFRSKQLEGLRQRALSNSDVKKIVMLSDFEGYRKVMEIARAHRL